MPFAKITLTNRAKKKAAKNFSMTDPQEQLDYLLGRAKNCLSSLQTVLNTLNKDYPCEGCKWVVCEDKVDLVRLGDLEWIEEEDIDNKPF